MPSALVIVALFVSHTAYGLYAGSGTAMPQVLPILLSAALVFSIIGWFAAYSRRERISWPLDMGCFLWLAWPFVVPYYVLKREGKRGLVRLGLFCLAYVAAWATGLALRIWLQVLA